MDKIDKLRAAIDDADVIVVGAGSGMSNATGLNFWYENSPLVMKKMGYFVKKYGFTGLFEGFYTNYESEEEHWGFYLGVLDIILNEPTPKPTYEYLQKILQDKTFHIITTNQDTLFKRYFKEEQISEIQGSWDYFQAQTPMIDDKLYPTKKYLEPLINKVKDGKLSTADIPRGKDGKPLTLWARGPEFIEGEKYFEEHEKFNRFIGKYKDKKVLFLELGVGRMTPMFIQEPFWEMTNYLPHATYVNINPKDALANEKIQDKSILINNDINEVLKEVVERGNN